MKKLRIIFRSPDILLEYAERPFAPIGTDDLPITAPLKALLKDLSRVHFEALARGTVPSEAERAIFGAQYEAVMLALEIELADYGEVVDEVFSDLFEPWFGAEVAQSREAARPSLSERLRQGLRCIIPVAPLRRRSSTSRP